VLDMTVEMRLPDQVLLRDGDGACALFLTPDRSLGGRDKPIVRSRSSSVLRSNDRESPGPRVEMM